MAPPLGTWNVVTNLNDALLNITNVDGQGNITGTIQLSATETHSVSGTWNATLKQLNFSYSFYIGSTFKIFFPVSFVGYLFEAGQPLFNASPGSTTPSWYLLAGTFQSGFQVFGQPHLNGWVARQPFS